MNKIQPCKCGEAERVDMKREFSRWCAVISPYNVHCYACGADGPRRESEEAAITAWNIQVLIPRWSDERLRELADAEPGGLMACSPEIMAELKEVARTDSAVNATLLAAGVYVKPDAWPWEKGGRDLDPNNPEDVAAWQERDRQAAALLVSDEIANCPDCIAAKKHAYSDATTPGFFYTECERHRNMLANRPVVAATLPAPGRYLIEEVRESGWYKSFPHHQHIAGGVGPHLLKDIRGNTAYCGGPKVCEFCIKGDPPTGDHQAINVDEIDLRTMSGMIVTREVSLTEARKIASGYPGLQTPDNQASNPTISDPQTKG
ncbi:MAG: hypothetical protein KGL39_50060 [Patescibacteria group bacterium]|nr:hypothetical protein [Patescibacteria group bacterium]